MRFLITGTAGFIGFHLARRLAAAGHEVVGYDGITANYDPALKRARLAELEKLASFTPIEAMLEDRGRLEAAMADFRPEVLIHLAAQAGVRYSVENPDAYVSANLVGTFNLLEAVRRYPVTHLMLASTSSVYGGNQKVPFSETDRTDFPVSLYASTKKATEALSHSHSHLFDIPTTAMRFFTVYGPWGRPDMALFRFVSAISEGRPIGTHGHGRMRRDFTFIDDLVEAIVRLVPIVPQRDRPVLTGRVADSLSPVAPWRVVNIGSGHPVALMEFIRTIEAALDKKAVVSMLPMQAGDVTQTFADPSLLEALTGYLPGTPLAAGIESFVRWFADYQARQQT